MGAVEWNVSAGAVLLFALTYFFDDSGMITALAPAVLIHELGHLLPLRLCGKPLRRVSLGLFGLELDYVGRLYGVQALLCLCGGPLLGIVYAVASCTLGGAFWRMSGTVSFLLSVFNLLPVLPLDGGRIVMAVADARFVRRLSRLAALVLLCAGTWLCAAYRALFPLGMGLWLTACNFREAVIK